MLFFGPFGTLHEIHKVAVLIDQDSICPATIIIGIYDNQVIPLPEDVPFVAAVITVPNLPCGTVFVSVGSRVCDNLTVPCGICLSGWLLPEYDQLILTVVSQIDEFYYVYHRNGIKGIHIIFGIF